VIAFAKRRHLADQVADRNTRSGQRCLFAAKRDPNCEVRPELVDVRRNSRRLAERYGSSRLAADSRFFGGRLRKR
jgi:hypothetical protein